MRRPTKTDENNAFATGVGRVRAGGGRVYLFFGNNVRAFFYGGGGGGGEAANGTRAHGRNVRPGGRAGAPTDGAYDDDATVPKIKLVRKPNRAPARRPANCRVNNAQANDTSIGVRVRV